MAGILSVFKARSQNMAEKPKKGKRLSENINKSEPDRVKMEMNILKDAVEGARTQNSPTWVDLYNLYEATESDSEVITQSQTAINKLHASNFVISKEGIDNDELTELFRTTWFADFLKFCFVAEKWGYTLIEFGQFDNDGEFISCDLFPHKNVYPFNRNIIVNESDVSGFHIGENPEQLYLIEVGKPSDLGLLKELTRVVIWKNFSQTDWSEHSEKWGAPMLIFKTDAEGDELEERRKAAANMRRNGFIITDTDDELEIKEASQNASAVDMYDKRIKLCNQDIAKMINGQYGTSEEKAFVGSAEVGERILNDYHSGRLRRYTSIINDQLIPFLTHHGYPLEKCKGRFTDLDPKADNTSTENGNKTKEKGKEGTQSQHDDGKKKALEDFLLTPW